VQSLGNKAVIGKVAENKDLGEISSGWTTASAGGGVKKREQM